MSTSITQSIIVMVSQGWSVRVPGSALLSVAEPAMFVADPDVSRGVKLAIALLTGVPWSAVKVMFSVLGDAGRAGRRLVTAGQVEADYIIQYEVGSAANASAASESLRKTLFAIQFSMLADEIRLQIQRAAEAAGRAAYNYQVQVESFADYSSLPPQVAREQTILVDDFFASNDTTSAANYSFGFLTLRKLTEEDIAAAMDTHTNLQIASQTGQTVVSVPSSELAALTAGCVISIIELAPGTAPQASRGKSEPLEIKGAISLTIFRAPGDSFKGLFTSPLTFTIPAKYSEGFRCAFWHETLGDWSLEGVDSSEDVTGNLVCHTFHLTVFAGIKRGFVETFACSQVTLLTADAFRRLWAGRQWYFDTEACLFLLLLFGLTLLLLIALKLDAGRCPDFPDDNFLLQQQAAVTIAPRWTASFDVKSGMGFDKMSSNISGFMVSERVHSNDAWLQADLGGDYELTSIVITWGVSKGMAKTYTVYGIEESGTEILMQSMTSMTKQNKRQDSIALTTDAEFQKVKFYLQSTWDNVDSPGYQFMINDITIRGRPARVLPPELLRMPSQATTVVQPRQSSRPASQRRCSAKLRDPLEDLLENGLLFVSDSCTRLERLSKDLQAASRQKGGALSSARLLTNHFIASMLRSHIRRQISASMLQSQDDVNFLLRSLEPSDAKKVGHGCVVSAPKVFSNYAGEISRLERVRRQFESEVVKLSKLRPRALLRGMTQRLLMQGPLGTLAYSIFMPSGMQVLLVMSQMLGALMASTFFLQKENCGESAAQLGVAELMGQELGKLLAVSFGSVLLAACPVKVLATLHKRKFKRYADEAVCCQDRVRQLRVWEVQDTAFWILGICYLCFCILFISLFLANAPKTSRKEWLLSSCWSLLVDTAILPFVLAVTLPLLCVLLLRSPVADKDAIAAQLRMGLRDRSGLTRETSQMSIVSLPNLISRTSLDMQISATMKNSAVEQGREDPAELPQQMYAHLCKLHGVNFVALKDASTTQNTNSGSESSEKVLDSRKEAKFPAVEELSSAVEELPSAVEGLSSVVISFDELTQSIDEARSPAVAQLSSASTQLSVASGKLAPAFADATLALTPASPKLVSASHEATPQATQPAGLQFNDRLHAQPSDSHSHHAGVSQEGGHALVSTFVRSMGKKYQTTRT